MPSWAGKLLVMGVMVCFVLCIPLWIPIAIVSRAAYLRRIRRAAKRFACVNCGRTLTVDALIRADEVWSEEERELMRENPGEIPRIIRTLHAICTGCGTRYSFNKRERTFVLETVTVCI